MEISGGISGAVNFYKADAGNKQNILNAAGGENKIYGSNIFSSEYAAAASAPEALKNIPQPKKKRKSKNRRLNTLDTDFLPDDAQEAETEKNFFKEQEINSPLKKIKQAADYFFTAAPLVNYFYLKHKGQELQETAAKLNDIVQNTDELMNSRVPYGESGSFYDSIAKNLTDAASIIGRADKKF